MSIHSILITIIATISPPSSPGDKDDQPTIKPLENQHFCCDKVGPGDGKGGGEGCVDIPKDHVRSCSAVLYCPGAWTSTDGTVTCY